MNSKMLWIVLISVFGMLSLLHGGDCPPEIKGDYFFVTKITSGKTDPKTTHLVPPAGGYVYEESLKCRCRAVYIHAFAARYAGSSKDPCFIRIELYGKSGKRIKQKSLFVNWRSKDLSGLQSLMIEEALEKKELNELGKKTYLSGKIILSHSKHISKKYISKIKVFVAAGDWAVVIKDLVIQFK